VFRGDESSAIACRRAEAPLAPGPQTRVGALLNPNPRRMLWVASLVLLGVWCVWWAISLYRGDLLGCRRSWFGSASAFGADFFTGCDYPTRVWLAGRDPYADKDIFFMYPPMVMRVFAWCGLVTSRQSAVIFVCALGLIAAAGAWAAWRTRRRLALSEIPLPTVVVAVLYSFPVVFAMERGNCDLLTVLLILCALVLLRRKSPFCQVAAGAILAIAPWLKMYPGLLGVGLVGLRRWHALTGFVLAGLLFGLVNFQEVQRFARNCTQYIHDVSELQKASPPASPHPWSHSIPENWRNLWRHTPRPIAWLALIEGHVAAALLLIPLLAWTTFHVFRSRRREELAYPLLIWVTAVGCFVPSAANDYSLVFLPIAALAVWDRHDPVFVHVGLAALLLWWQPFGLPIDGSVLFVLKVAGLAVVGVSLAERASAPMPLAVVQAEDPGLDAPIRIAA
jgi:hypothetical protein